MEITRESGRFMLLNSIQALVKYLDKVSDPISSPDSWPKAVLGSNIFSHCEILIAAGRPLPQQATQVAVETFQLYTN
jgi:hypothetical protein